MRIYLDLQKRCIVSEIKRQYELALQQALRARNPDREQELKAEVLGQIQEKADLVGLRGKYSKLQAGSAARVWLSLDEQGGCRLYLEDEPVLEMDLDRLNISEVIDNDYNDDNDNEA
ncbi:MAG: hypothetical protein R6U22_07460 [Desulfohalobiaceae bacterium]